MTKNKVKFIYSPIYDEHFRDWIKQIKGDLSEYPSTDYVLEYIKEVEILWRSVEEKVLLLLSKESKMTWDDNIINCYVVGNCIPFSDPLTMKPYESKNTFIDKLVHELIHQLFSQDRNFKKYKEIYKYIESEYPNESRRTKIHIIIYALHSAVYKKIFSEDRMNADMEFSKQFKDYERAWEIVNKDGSNKILELFLKIPSY